MLSVDVIALHGACVLHAQRAVSATPTQPRGGKGQAPGYGLPVSGGSGVLGRMGHGER